MPVPAMTRPASDGPMPVRSCRIAATKGGIPKIRLPSVITSA